VIADDELYAGVFSRDDLTHPLCPNSAVHISNALHFAHKLILVELWVLGLQPVQPLWSANFLDVNISEQCLKMMVPFGNIRSRKSWSSPEKVVHLYS